MKDWTQHHVITGETMIGTHRHVLYTRFERGEDGGMRLVQWLEGEYSSGNTQMVTLESADVDALLRYIKTSEPE